MARIQPLIVIFYCITKTRSGQEQIAIFTSFSRKNSTFLFQNTVIHAKIAFFAGIFMLYPRDS
jgi:hypothetical protein